MLVATTGVVSRAAAPLIQMPITYGVRVGGWNIVISAITKNHLWQGSSYVNQGPVVDCNVQRIGH